MTTSCSSSSKFLSRSPVLGLVLTFAYAWTPSGDGIENVSLAVVKAGEDEEVMFTAMDRLERVDVSKLASKRP
jgi:hypothetical protein